MDKRKLHHQYKNIKKIHSWYFLCAGVFFLIIGVVSMRQNNLHMIQLREKVYLADEKGTDVEKPLRELRGYVYSHMNTDLSSGNVSITPPVQLTHRYERLIKQEQEKADKINKKVKQQAEEVCAKKFPSSGLNTDRVNCVAKYTSDNAQQPEQIPSALYKYDFISPVWSPDLAGISLLLALLFFAATIARAVLGYWYRSILD